MKLTFILLVLTLQVSATAYSQLISLNFTKAPLRDVLQSIRKQSGYNFVAASDELSKANPVSINIKSTSIDEILHSVFSNQPFVYKLEHNIIMISLKNVEKENKFTGKQSVPQENPLEGIVIDDNGVPLPGVTVVIKNLNMGAITDRFGRFTFDDAPNTGVLIFTMVGRESREVSYKNHTLQKIKLKEVDAALKEFQVIAYGTTVKKYNTSNITTVNAKDIAKQPVNNLLLALQGRVTGMFTAQTSGQTVGNINVNIQGVNSLGNGSDPFYVIDGVPYTPQFTGSSLLGLNLVGSGGSTFNFINPADIESVAVLKDADATAIYGSRAANGAVLITTKKGKAGKTKVDINLRQGWGKINHHTNLLNTQQFLEMRKEAYVNAEIPVPTSATNPNTSNFDLTIWDPNRDTDWQKELVGKTAQFTDLQASISGGSANTQFLAGYGYNRQTTVYLNNLSDIKGNIHLNVNHNSTNNKFKYQITATYLQDKNQLNNIDLMDVATQLAPNAPPLYNNDGTINWEPYPKNPARFSFNNPIAPTKNTYTGNTNNLTGTNTISYELMPGLDVKSSVGFNRLSAVETQIYPLIAKRPDGINLTRTSNYLNKSITSWSIEPQITYAKDGKLGVINALLGSSFQQITNDVLSQTGSGYTNDAQLLNMSAASSVIINNVEKLLYKYNALFGRINYRLKNKYIINLTIRRDGSSRFGDENKLHTFYSMGGAWLFGDENWMKEHLSWLSLGKLRTSYGTTGNDQIRDYRYLSLLNSYTVDIPYQGSVGLSQSNIANPFIQWEETKKLNLGIDLGFVDNRVLLSVNFYRNRSSNQLISYMLPSTTGFGDVDRNFPATIQNKGLELQLDLTPVRTKNFVWQSSFNVSFQRNTLIAFPDLATSPYANQYIIGKPINIRRLFKFSGVNKTTGLYEFVTSKGELTSSPSESEDRTVLLDPNPSSFGGFSNNFQYKGLELDFLLQFVNQKASGLRFGNYPGLGSSSGNQPSVILDRWRSPGDVVQVQRFSATDDIAVPFESAVESDANYTGASYIRLKNASLSYSFSKTLLKRINISQTKIFIQGQNLLTFTKFVGTDPETIGLGVLPPLRMIALGLQLTFQ